MKATGVIKWCEKCHKDYEIFSDDGCGDFSACWNWCPHCGLRQELWMRFRNPNVRDDTPMAISCEEAFKKYGDVKITEA
jgi:hypothetical protein